MFKRFKRYLLRCKWDVYRDNVNKNGDSVLLTAFSGLTLLKDMVIDEITLLECSEYYITPPSYSLHNMLLELRTALQGLRTDGTIIPLKCDENITRLRLDTWYLTDQIDDYKHLTILTAYLEAVNILNQIKDTVSVKQYTYIERRCRRSITSFNILTEVIGIIIYTK